MGKRESWFSAIKRVFTHNSKEKRTDGPDKKSSSRERKKGKGFIPLFREPSSIEKILGEADQLLIRPHTPLEQPKSPPVRLVSPRAASPKAASNRHSPNVTSPRAVSPPRTLSTGAISPKAAPARTKDASPPRTLSTGAISPTAAPARTKEVSPPRTLSTGAISPKAAPAITKDSTPPEAFTIDAAAPKMTQSRKETRYLQRPEPTLRDQQLSATKLQSAYRGHLARQSFRGLKGLERLQGVVKGQNVKRQTANAMKQMRLLVRVQTQIQSRRIHMLENQSYNNDKEAALSQLSAQSEAGQNGDWDDSSLTKEEVEARLRKKVEAVIKRERATAYAYSHRLWKSTPKSVQNPLDMRSNRFPWWWNWLERQLLQIGSSQSQAATRNIMLTPPRRNSKCKPSPSSSPSPRPQRHASTSKLGNFAASDNRASITPRSSRSAIPFRSKQFQTTPNRSPLAEPRTSAAYDARLKDDDSLVSCPPFSFPNYMTPTVSANAKSRANSNPRERFPGTDSNRKLSFPLTPDVDSFRWNKGSKRDSASQRGTDKWEDSRSMGDLSVNSTVSMPAALVGRRPFNRFV